MLLANINFLDVKKVEFCCFGVILGRQKWSYVAILTTHNLKKKI
jgi:hypothetical protein